MARAGATHHARSWSATRATCGRRDGAQQVIRDWVERGGRWSPCTARTRRSTSTADGWARAARSPAVDRHARLAVHRPPADRARTSSRTSHPTTGSSPASSRSRPTDELYLNEYPDRDGARSRCCRPRISGDARGFVEADWNDTDPDHLVMYLRPLGDGAVLYNTLGHCRGHYDMVPLKDYYPQRRSLLVGPAGVLRVAAPLAALGARRDVVTSTIEGARWTLTPRSTARHAPQHGAHPAVRGGRRAG